VIGILEVTTRLSKRIAPVRCKKTIIHRLNKRLKKKLLWNFVIRLFIEAALEIAFCVYLNLVYGEFNIKVLGSWFNFISSCILGISLALLPIWIIFFYLRNFDRLEDEKFSEKYGATYEGLKANEKTWIIYPVYFVIRRVLFMVISLLLYHFVMFQLILMILLTLASACYILHIRPFDEHLVNNLEAMNEIFTLMLLNVTFCFSDLVDNVRTQYLCGYFFIFFMCACILAHLFFLFKDIVWQLILTFKRWRYRRNNPHLFKPKPSCLKRLRDQAVAPEDKLETARPLSDKADLEENKLEEIKEESNEEERDDEESDEYDEEGYEDDEESS